jgi:DNA-binding response OmpR family regulator/regulator of sirC expression with transglutaminase-like and TPR domain
MLSVLVIDDQKPMLEVIRLFLERFGNMNVKTALNAKEALTLLMSSSFDAMVVDYDLPEINGIDFLKMLRARGDTTPVIIFTGVGREYAAIQALNNGADFFLKKGDDAQSQLLEMVHMIRQAVDRRNLGRGPGTTQKILSDALNFFHQAAYVIDREGKVMVWNKGMEKMTGVAEGDILGKADWDYSIPFFGHRAPMLSDLIFQDDATIAENNYTIIEKEKGTITAWIKAIPEEGRQNILWMKSIALYDSKGMFIGVMGKIRDITEEMGPELLNKSQTAISPASEPAPSSPKGMFDKILGKAKASYKEGLRLSFREGKYTEAIPFFDQAIEIDPGLAYFWHDRGVCYRELGKDSEALRNFDKAVELAPDDEEFLFSRGEMLKQIGILRQRRDLIESAVLVLNRVVDLNPNQADAWNSLGVLSKELGKEQLSRQYYEKARNLIKNGKNKKKTRPLDLQV